MKLDFWGISNIHRKLHIKVSTENVTELQILVFFGLFHVFVQMTLSSFFLHQGLGHEDAEMKKKTCQELNSWKSDKNTEFSNNQ